MSVADIRYHGRMGRWEPNGRGRLEQAAMELYSERGFEQTTVAEIAARAGLTERTFFRHFADKREVLFWGAASLQELMVTTLAATPDSRLRSRPWPAPSRPPEHCSSSDGTTPGPARPSSWPIPSSRSGS